MMMMMMMQYRLKFICSSEMCGTLAGVDTPIRKFINFFSDTRFVCFSQLGADGSTARSVRVQDAEQLAICRPRRGR